MTERTFRSLRYGHPGQAVYASQSREWKFVRRASNSWRFEILGEPSISILPSMQTIEPVLSSTESLQLQNQRTMRRYPETFPGALYARFESKISEIISLQTSYLDPTQGELLDFGHAVFQNSSNTVNVAAMAGGPAGELLRLLPMKAVSHGWDMARAKWIESLEPNLADVGWWSGVGQPIQQIRFAHLPYEKLTFLAIRTTVTVSVFAPVRRNSAITSKRLYPGGNSLSASRFDPNHLFTISVEQLEHSPPADVSFNPWDQRQFGVVNQLGRWSIWEFQRMNVNPKAINVRRAEQVKSGQMPKASRERADSRDVFEDGWHCIMWITNLKTVVVCSRIALVICDVSSELLSTETSELGISENTGLLLDICRHPVFENHVFVTTTTEIFWLSVLENHSANMDQAEKSRIQIQLSWTHFRDPKDTSLRTTVFRDDDDNGKSHRATSLCRSNVVSRDQKSSYSCILASEVSLLLSDSRWMNQLPFQSQCLIPYAFLCRPHSLPIRLLEMARPEVLIRLPLNECRIAPLQTSGTSNFQEEHGTSTKNEEYASTIYQFYGVTYRWELYSTTSFQMVWSIQPSPSLGTWRFESQHGSVFNR